jgi:hypothetical protein
MKKAFRLGQLAATPGALRALDAAYMTEILGRHARGDWGVVDRDDARMNDRALAGGDRILSAYPRNPAEPNGERVWIITERDRSSTTILLPEEY